jgi:hypothetical protein
MNDIENVYEMACGNRHILFVPNVVIQIYLKRYLWELQKPAEMLIDNVIKVLFLIAKDILNL